MLCTPLAGSLAVPGVKDTSSEVKRKREEDVRSPLEKVVS
jgi:hypothetical protein